MMAHPVKTNFPVTVPQVEIAHDLALMGDIDMVAQRHGITPADIAVLLKRPEFTKVLNEFQEVMIKEVKYYITSRAKDAVKVVEGIMKNEEANDKVRLSAARDLLDRAGLAAKHQSELNIKNTYNYVTNLSDEELDKLIEELEIESKESGEI